VADRSHYSCDDDSSADDGEYEKREEPQSLQRQVITKSISDNSLNSRRGDECDQSAYENQNHIKVSNEYDY
jgi:hypothetical protein